MWPFAVQMPMGQMPTTMMQQQPQQGMMMQQQQPMGRVGMVRSPACCVQSPSRLCSPRLAPSFTPQLTWDVCSNLRCNLSNSHSSNSRAVGKSAASSEQSGLCCAVAGSLMRELELDSLCIFRAKCTPPHAARPTNVSLSAVRHRADIDACRNVIRGRRPLTRLRGDDGAWAWAASEVVC